MIVHKSFKYYHLCDVQFAHNSRLMTFAAAGFILEKIKQKKNRHSAKNVSKAPTQIVQRELYYSWQTS